MRRRDGEGIANDRQAELRDRTRGKHVLHEPQRQQEERRQHGKVTQRRRKLVARWNEALDLESQRWERHGSDERVVESERACVHTRSRTASESNARQAGTRRSNETNERNKSNVVPHSSSLVGRCIVDRQSMCEPACLLLILMYT